MDLFPGLDGLNRWFYLAGLDGLDEEINGQYLPELDGVE